MEREALLVYLQHLLDLEYAKKQLKKIFDLKQFALEKELRKKQKQLEQYYDYYDREIKEIEKEPELRESYDISEVSGLGVLGILLIVIGVFGFIGFLFFRVSFSRYFFLYFAMVAVAVGGILCLKVYGDKKEKNAESERRIIERYNNKLLDEHQKRLREIPKLKREYRKNYNTIRHEIAKIEAEMQECREFYYREDSEMDLLLWNSYSENIIPKQFHGLEPIAYIYNYMKSSQESLTSALHHVHMENGIVRIERGIMALYMQNEEMLFLQRCQLAETKMTNQNLSAIGSDVQQIKANTQEISDRSLDILRASQQSAKNTEEAAKYARIAANYAEADAFFGAANYFRTH